MVMVRWTSIVRVSLIWIVPLLACGGSSSADAAGALDAAFGADGATPDAGGRDGSDGSDGARDVASGNDGVVDVGGRETLLPEVDSGTCMGNCIDRLTAECPFVGFSCVSMTSGDNTYACYSNGVKVHRTVYSNGSAYRVKKSNGDDCYTNQRMGNDEVFTVSSVIEVQITHNYDLAGNTRVVCRGGPTYQYPATSPACVAEQQATMACTPGACAAF